MRRNPGWPRAADAVGNGRDVEWLATVRWEVVVQAILTATVGLAAMYLPRRHKVADAQAEGSTEVRKAEIASRDGLFDHYQQALKAQDERHGAALARLSDEIAAVRSEHGECRAELDIARGAIEDMRTELRRVEETATRERVQMEALKMAVSRADPEWYDRIVQLATDMQPGK